MVVLVVLVLLVFFSRNIRNLLGDLGGFDAPYLACCCPTLPRAGGSYYVISPYRIHTLQLLTDNVADSWMLVPTVLCFFTPSFIAKFGCVYAGLVVPSLNSIKVNLERLRLVKGLGMHVYCSVDCSVSIIRCVGGTAETVGDIRRSL